MKLSIAAVALLGALLSPDAASAKMFRSRAANRRSNNGQAPPGRCETYSGQGKQKHMNLPLMTKLLSPNQGPAFLEPGDTYFTLIDKPDLPIVESGINTCQIILVEPLYELSCHLILNGPNGSITASGDGAPNPIAYEGSQPVKYAITGGTDLYVGAWGQIDLDLFPIVPLDAEENPVGPEDDPASVVKIVSEFEFNMTLCY